MLNRQGKIVDHDQMPGSPAKYIPLQRIIYDNASYNYDKETQAQVCRTHAAGQLLHSRLAQFPAV